MNPITLSDLVTAVTVDVFTAIGIFVALRFGGVAWCFLGGVVGYDLFRFVIVPLISRHRHSQEETQ